MAPETDTATAAIDDFLRHLVDGDLPDIELFELKACVFDLIAERAEDDLDAAACRGIAEGARAVVAELGPAIVLAPPDGVCTPCWLFTHSRCERYASCTCPTCHPHRRSPSEGDGKHA